jgi:acetylornithine/succinyldiaminopimelate/putrescine aminotransferase
MAQGLLVIPTGAKVVRFVPPLVCGNSDVEQAANLFKRSLLRVIEGSS